VWPQLPIPSTALNCLSPQLPIPSIAYPLNCLSPQLPIPSIALNCLSPQLPQGSVWPAGRYTGQEPVLDFILSTLITPRTVSAVLHAAKKVLSSSTRPSKDVPTSEVDIQHSLALLSTAMRAVETCLQAGGWAVLSITASADHFWGNTKALI
jgi:hypothetical protein